MAGLDRAKWYRITSNKSDSWSLETQAFVHTAVGSVYFQKPNPSTENQLWQLYASTNGSYVLRSGEGGPNMFLVTQWNTKFEGDINDGSTVPQMMPSSQINDYSMFWSIQPWLDGTYWMENFQNGSKYHLEKQPDPGGLMRMSSNITGDQPGQKFNFKPIRQIDDIKFSTLSLPSFSTSTSSTSSLFHSKATTRFSTTSSISPSQTSASTSSNQPPGKSLPTGSQAAIGATIGSIICLSIIIGLVVYWRRRKAVRTHGMEITTRAPLAEMSGQQAAAEMDVTSVGPMKGLTAELPNILPPVELDSSTIK